MNTFAKITLLACVASAVTACGGNDVADALNIGAPRVRLVDAIPGSAGVQLYRNDNLQTDAGTPAYGQASAYFDTVTSTSTWSLRDPATGLQIGSTSLRAAGSTRYSLIAFAGSGTQADMLQVSDPYDVDITSDKARVRLVNGASGAGAVDVYLGSVGASLASQTPLLANVAFEGASPASGSNSTTIAAGTYEIRLTVSGTKTVLFDGTMVAGTQEDLLLLALPAASGAATAVKVLAIPAAGGDSVSELPGL